MYCKEKKCMTLCITKEESDLFERASKYMQDILSRMMAHDLTTLSDSNGCTVGTYDEVQITSNIVSKIAMEMEIDNRGAKK